MSDLDEVLRLKEEDKQDGRHYAWVLDERKHGQSSSMQQIMAQAKGYETVKVSDEDGKKFALGTLRQGADGLVRVGDLVLMSCPREEYEKRKAEQDLKSNPYRALQNKKEEFNEAAAEAGIKPLES